MHNLVLFATIYKNQDMILKEWLEHHEQQGFDHIYLINTGVSDSFYNIIYPYVKSGLVTVFNLPADTSHQGSNYDLIFKALKYDIKWLATSTVNEYWYGTKDTLKNYIEEIDTSVVDINSIYTYAYLFGSSGYTEQPKSIRESFIKRAEPQYQFKTITRADCIVNIDEICTLNTQPLIKLNYDDIKVNYYNVMSAECFTHTRLCNGEDSEQMKHGWEYFKQNDINEARDMTLANIAKENRDKVVGRITSSSKLNEIQKIIKERENKAIQLKITQ